MTTAKLKGARVGLPRGRPAGAGRWVIWSLPARVLVVIIVVEVLAAVALAADVVTGVGELPPIWPVLLAVLVAGGVVGTEASLGVERVRLRSDESPHIDLSSVWAFASAVLLPGPLACGVGVIIYAHIYLRIWRRTGVPVHRVLFSTATVVLAVQAAAAVVDVAGAGDPFRTVPGLVAVVLALVTYAAVNMVLVVAVIVLSGPSRDVPTFLQVLGHSDDAVLEFATLSLGALVAAAMASFGPAYAVLVLPPLIVLHRTVLVRQLEEAASTDGKTGLLNATAWHVQAGREVLRAERIQSMATVLIVDLDHFKLVNDKHGHLVGDQVLVAVATAVRDEVRDDDLVGRFGGEEFVVLLRGVDGDEGRIDAEAVAERIRRRVEGLRLNLSGTEGRLVIDVRTNSVGGATYPLHGNDLPRLVEVADAAMYAAKRAGRNTVRMGMPAGPGAV